MSGLGRHSGKPLKPHGHGLPPELGREAALDQATRLTRGAYVLPIILVAIWGTTRYANDRPLWFWFSAVAMLLATAIRLVVSGMRERIYNTHPGFLAWIGVFTVAISSGPSGLIFANALGIYGFENWMFILMVIWSVGRASGSTISFAPSFRLLQFNIFLLLGPVLAESLLLGTSRGRAFAFLDACLIGFLLLQGYPLYKSYWKQLQGRALETARARELEAAKIAAESANLAKSQFLANMSHEIRTPMHGILGMAQLAIGSETPQEAREYVKTLRTSAESLLHVLNDILDFSKIEAGKLTLERVPFSVRHSVDEVQKMISTQARAKGLVLECRVADDVPDLLIGDPMRLHQVLVNLLGNALKFTEFGSVNLQVTRDGALSLNSEIGLLFRVSDTGIGIPEEQQKTIFNAFAQADGSVTRRFGGSGLGLAISSQLVQLMGGRLSVESTLNIGSAFQFTCRLGIARQQELAVEPTGSSAQEPPMRILLAEDNPVNQMVAIKLLARRGHTVKVATTGLEAVQAWEREPFDLIFMDEQMPAMDGVEAVRQIRARELENGSTRTAIIALTASAMKGDRERFIAAGMDGYLAKPFTSEELYAAIRNSVTSVMLRG